MFVTPSRYAVSRRGNGRMAIRTTQGIRVRLLALLLVASVIPYAVGTKLERAGEQPRPSEQTVSAPAAEQPHSEQAEGQPQELAHTEAQENIRPDQENPKSAATEARGEEIFGFNPETPQLRVAVIVAFILLAATVWLFPGLTLLLLGVALFGALVTLFDVREIMFQMGRGRAALASMAALTAVFHLGAAAIAFLLFRSQLASPGRS